MLGPDEIARIKADPKFRELERKRSALSWTLCIIMLVIYFGFIALLAFDEPLVSTQIWGVVTVAFPLGLFVILAAIVLTGLYVVRANSDFDALNRDLVATMARRNAAARTMRA